MGPESRITEAEAEKGRCHLCHRRLLERPDATLDDITRLPGELDGVLVHKSCAVLGGLQHPTLQRPD